MENMKYLSEYDNEIWYLEALEAYRESKEE